MPYHLEKGPIFSAFEAVYNDPVGLPKFLYDLWTGGANVLGTLGILASTSIDNPTGGGPNATGAQRLESMSRHWFGEGPQTQPQPAFGSIDPNSGGQVTQTGYWAGYYGDVRGIVAETLKRAGEVALGVDRPANPTGPPVGTRHWPVEFFWKCSQPRFEGWVTWRRHGQGPDGQVNVILATPPTPSLVLPNPGGPDHRGRETAMPVTSTATTSSAWQGSMVTAHTEHHQHVVLTWKPTGMRGWVAPHAGITTEGRGPIGTWSPNWHNGGAPEQPLLLANVSPTIPDPPP